MSGLFRYALGGLQISSELEITGWEEASLVTGEPDVQIYIEICLDPPVEYSFGLCQAGFQISIPGMGRYLIRGGCEIGINRVAGTTDDEVRMWLRGPAMGVLFHQRGLLPLHASASVIDGGCAAFVGPSGAGKSTMSAFLAQRGYTVASDDVLAVSPHGSGALQVISGSSSLRLNADSLIARAAGFEGPHGLQMHDNKYVLQLNVAPAKPLPLRYLYVLEDLPGLDKCALVALTGAEALGRVLTNVYRPEFALSMETFKLTFALSAAVANQAVICRLLRPKSFHRIPDVLALLEWQWSGNAATTVQR